MHYMVVHQLNSGEARTNVWDLKDQRRGDLDVHQATEAVFGALIGQRWVWGVDAKGVGYCLPERALQGITVAPVQTAEGPAGTPAPTTAPLAEKDRQDAGPTEEPLWARKHTL